MNRKVNYKFFIVGFVFVLMLILSACGGKKINAPTEVTIDENNNLIWKGVDEAKTYTISFYFIDEDIETQEQTRKTSFSLDNLKEGDYIIKVLSNSGDKSLKDSVYSEALEYHKYYETGCVYKLINNNTEYQIAKVGKATGAFEIEDFYRGKAVTSIADAAFKGSTRITNVTIGKNISSIGDNAFYNCSKLVEVIIPDSVRSIGKSCFQSCRSLSNVKISKAISELNPFTFAYCRSLVEVEIPSNVEVLGESCFQDCSALVEVRIPDSVNSIGQYCFSACSALKKVKIGDNLTSISDYAFYKNTLLTDIDFSGKTNLKSIGKYAFSECFALENVRIPSGVETLAMYSFYNCPKLENILIASTVNQIGSFSFNRTKFYNDALDRGDDFMYADNWLVGCNPEIKQTLVEINTETLKNTIVGIADNVFADSPAIETVVLPASFKYIGQKAFSGCGNLWKLQTLDDSIEVIGDYAFANCVLTSIKLGIGLKKIGSYAFYNNPQLDNNSLSPTTWIPETVNTIGTRAFKNTRLWTNTRDKDGIVYAANWVVGYTNEFIGSVVLNIDTKRVAGIADYAFYKAENLMSITGLVNCRYIGRGAFQGCTKLSSITLNRNLTEIRDKTFYECSSLLMVSFPRTLQSIGSYAFYKCTHLTEVQLSSTNCVSIGKSAFYMDANIKEVTFGKSLVSIDDYAFYRCNSIKNITFTEKIENVGKKAFYRCGSLESVVLNDKVKNILEGTFYECINLKEITITDSIENIGRSAFYNCSNVTKVTLGNSVKTIGDYAFYGLNQVEFIKLPESLNSIGNYAFKGFEAMTSIVLPKTVKVIGQHAFYGCPSLTFYTDAESILGEWHERFNSLYRPIFWGVTLDDNNDVISVTVSTELFVNYQAKNGISNPRSEDKKFVGWIDEDSNAFTFEGFEKIEKESKLTAIYE